MKASVIKAWLFKSESAGWRRYQTLQYSDGTLSCDCPGWTRRVSSDGSRTCRHVRLVQLGAADTAALAVTGSPASLPGDDERHATATMARDWGKASKPQAPLTGRRFDFD